MGRRRRRLQPLLGLLMFINFLFISLGALFLWWLLSSKEGI